MEVEAYEDGKYRQDRRPRRHRRGEGQRRYRRAPRGRRDDGLPPMKLPEPRPAPAAEAAPEQQAAAEPPKPSAPKKNPTPPPSANGEASAHIFASPLARRMAKEAGLNLTAIHGTGPHGRIIEADIGAAKAGWCCAACRLTRTRDIRPRDLRYVRAGQLRARAAQQDAPRHRRAPDEGKQRSPISISPPITRSMRCWPSAMGSTVRPRRAKTASPPIMSRSTTSSSRRSRGR